MVKKNKMRDAVRAARRSAREDRVAALRQGIRHHGGPWTDRKKEANKKLARQRVEW